MRSLQVRVALAVLAAMAITLAVVLSLVLSTFASRERESLDERLYSTLAVTKQVGMAAGLTPESDDDRPAGFRGRRIGLVAARNGVGVVVATAQDRPIVRFGAAVDDTALRPLDADRGPLDLETVGVSLRGVRETETLLVSDEPTVVSITVLAPREATDARIAALRGRVLTVGGGGLLLAILLAVAAARLALRSLIRLRTEAAGIVPGGDDRLTGGGPTEVDALASTLNGLLQRVQLSAAERDGALEASRRFAADAGHELRTPLATMGADLRTLADHGAVTPVQREIIDDLLSEHVRVRSLLEALQELARGDAGTVIERHLVDLGQLVDAAVEHSRGRHPAAVFSTTVTDPDAPYVIGWEQGLALALDNLLDNAALHGGGNIEVHIDGADDRFVELVVEDDGPGVPAADRERILQRFERGACPRVPGSGLGLALVAQQAQLHDGGLSVGESALGGARFVLRLRRAQDDKPALTCPRSPARASPTSPVSSRPRRCTR